MEQILNYELIPTKQWDRILFLDVMRGTVLFGILWMVIKMWLLGDSLRSSATKPLILSTFFLFSLGTLWEYIDYRNDKKGWTEVTEAKVILDTGKEIFVGPIWLPHFLYGPMEWRWRNLSYQKAHALRKVLSQTD
ncbi:DUF418 domain-containing protein [Algoriphagus sp.]|uniref:DUF418 domain-containing protein n=1 Tax=Algoriphagus sp. TaxID=1872435 RepID=UPI003286C17B